MAVTVREDVSLRCQPCLPALELLPAWVGATLIASPPQIAVLPSLMGLKTAISLSAVILQRIGSLRQSQTGAEGRLRDIPELEKAEPSSPLSENGLPLLRRGRPAPFSLDCPSEP